MRSSSRETVALRYFFGTISQLTPAQIELSLAPANLTPSTASTPRAGCTGVFERLSPGWKIGERIFQRPPVDPALLVADLRVDRDSRPILPGTRRFWSAVFLDPVVARESESRRRPASVANEPPVDLGLALRTDLLTDTADQHRRYYSVLFVSRTLDRVTPGNVRDAIDAARATMRYPALISTLERAHVKDVAVLASAGRRAEQLSTIADAGRMVRSLTEFQATLALLTRAGLRGSLSADRLTTWVASLCALEPDERGDYDGRVVKWLDERIHELSVNGAATSNDLTDQDVLNLIAGPVPPKPFIVEWEGTRYQIDFTKAETTRLEQLLGDAPPPYLSSARALVGVADTVEADGLTAERLRAQASVFDRAAHSVSLDVAETWNETDAHARYRDTNGRLSRAAEGGDLRAAARVAPELRLLADDLVARGLMELTYATAMGQRERTAISADDAARRHDFGWRLMGRHTGPWLFPVAGVGPRGWRVVGSVLGLDVSLAEFSLLPLSSKLPPRRPTLGDDDRRVMIDAVALITPAELTDGDGEAIVAALQKGRARVAATHTPVEGASLADDVRLSPIRRTLLAWTLRHDPSRAATFFSLTELLWLGRDAVPIEPNLDAWGAPVQARTGCLCLQMLDPRPVDDFMGRWGTGVKMTGFPDSEPAARRASHGAAHAGAAARAGARVRITRLREQRGHPRPGRSARRSLEFVQTLRADRVELYLALLTTDGPLVPGRGLGRPSTRKERRGDESRSGPLLQQPPSCGRCSRARISSRSCRSHRRSRTRSSAARRGSRRRSIRRSTARRSPSSSTAGSPARRSARRSPAPGIPAVSFAAITSASSRRCRTDAGSSDNVRTKDLGYTEKVRTDAVLVPVIVTDGGQFVRGLKQQDFEIYEDGVQQPIASHGQRGRAARSGPRDRRQRQHGAFAAAGEIRGQAAPDEAAAGRCGDARRLQRHDVHRRRAREGSKGARSRRRAADVVGRHRALRRHRSGRSIWSAATGAARAS